MKRLVFILVVITSSLLHAQSWGSLPVDMVVTMNTSSPGTAMTSTIFNAGIQTSECTPGTNCGWNQFAGTNRFTVGANQGACSNLGQVTLNGGSTTFAAQSMNYNNTAHQDQTTTDREAIYFNGPSGKSNVSVISCITLGTPSQGNGTDWDIQGLWDNGGHYVMTQLNNSCNSSNEFGVRLESDYNGSTTHSATCIPLIPYQLLSGQPQSYNTYWVVTNYNMNSVTCGTFSSVGCGTLTIYTVDGTKVGQINVPAPSGGTLGTSAGLGISIGNYESGTDTGNYTYFQNVMVDWTSGSIDPFWAQSDPWTGVVAPGRAASWTGNAGVSGGIPNRTNICSSLTSSATTSQIDTAISNCSSAGGGVVYLAAGTYSNATTGICFNGAANVTLRGAGANQTFLVPTTAASCSGGPASPLVIGSNDNNFKTSISNGPVTVSGMLNPGSNTISLSSVSNLKVGNPIILDQLNNTNDQGGVIVAQSDATSSGSTSPGINGPYSTSGNAGGDARCSSASSDTSCYSQEQVVTVTQCDGNTTAGHTCSSGANITISPGLRMPNWSTGQTMSAWWSSSPALNDGVENLSVNTSGLSGDTGIDIWNCLNCWVAGVTSTNAALASIQIEYSQHVSVIDSYLFLTQNGSTSSYGVFCFSGSDVLVENNIMQAVTSATLSETCSGSVIDYNFAVNAYYPANPGYNVNNHGDHSVGVDTELLEGNIFNLHTADVIHGTRNFITDFRNNIYGPQPACYASGSTYATSVYGACTSGLTPMQIYAFSRFYNLIGNVVGTSGTNTNYCNGANSSCGSPVANNTNNFGIGYGNSPVPNDPNVQTTIVLWGNSDPVTGYSSPRFNCSEIATFPTSGTATSSLVPAQFNYYNPCPASNTLPASFFYASKPSWLGSKPWPLIGPDVSSGNVEVCTGGTYTGALVNSSSLCTGTGGAAGTWSNGEVNSNQAMDCYFALGGNPYGTGAQLSFNAAVCYSNDPGGFAVPPTCSTNCAGNYTGSVVATFANSNSGTTIMCYTTNGSTPATNGSGTGCTTGTSLSGSSGNVTVSASETVEVVAGTSTLSDSSVLSEAYTINSSSPSSAVGATAVGVSIN